MRENDFMDDVKEAAFENNLNTSPYPGHYWCVWCLETSPARTDFSVDHIIPESRGGGDDEENACILCKSCNSAKSNNYLPRRRPVRLALTEKQQGEIARIADVLAGQVYDEELARTFLGRADY
jgi:5-methylcytosine-specific restriction endonuclease McrA